MSIFFFLIIMIRTYVLCTNPKSRNYQNSLHYMQN